jgi:hypothetical protein
LQKEPSNRIHFGFFMETPLLESFQKFSDRIMRKGKFGKSPDASMAPEN